MDMLIQGFTSIMYFDALLWCFIGVAIGTLVGALPGLGPTAGVAILLPLSFSLEVVSALLLLTGIYQGTMYGGRISSILINVPGDAPAVVSTFDGYPMTLQGKAGYALALSAIASFIGGSLGFLGLAFLTPHISNWAIIFNAPEYFSLMLFALIATSGLGGGSFLKSLIATFFGLLIALVGSDAIQGTNRMTFGLVELWDGIDFVVVAIGMFGLSEMLLRIEEREGVVHNYSKKILFKELFPTIRQIIANLGAIIRGSFVGFFVGVLPGAGSTIATFFSYSLEKKISKTPEEFGKGKDQGLSAPESANNASVGGALIPLFSLGIPGSATTAILLGALIMFGLQPGPLLFEKSGDIIWAVIAGLIVANIFLLVLNTAFVPFFTYLIKVAEPYLIPIVSIFCFLGVYLLNNSFFDVLLMIIFGIIGYFLRKNDFPLAPLILALVLGPMLEDNFRRSLLMSRNDYMIFLERPISLILILITVVIIFYPFFTKLTKKATK